MNDEQREQSEEQQSNDLGCDPDAPVIPHTIPSSGEARYSANQENRTQRYIERATERVRRRWPSGATWTALATVVAAIATCVYAFYAYHQWQTMRGQLDEMSAARRPWLGPVGELKMTRPPDFQVSELPDASPQLEELKKKYPYIDKPMVSIRVWISWAFQNYGASPARRVNHTAIVYATDDPRNPPVETKNMACIIGNQMEHHPEALTTAVFPGNTITLPETDGISGMIPGTKAIAAVWVMECITYEGAVGDVLHHTRILWVSDFSGPAGKPELAIENPPVTWTPFTKFRLVESDVD